jgi:acylphosphatase
MEDAFETRLVRVRGIVQGVGFRESCVRHARAQGISGWVRNRTDGSVEALLHGPPSRVAAMCDWLRKGVPGARVDSLAQSPAAAPSPLPVSFERLPTL